MTSPSRYGLERIRIGLAHFLAGKVLSSIGGIVTLLLVVRGLSLGSFATYSVFVGFIEIFTAISGLGLTHIALRYAPELYAQHWDHPLRRLLVWLLGLRAFALVLVIVLAYLAAAPMLAWFGLESWLDAFRVFLVVILLRVLANTVFSTLEALLHQSLAQRGVMVTTFARLALVSWYYAHDALTLHILLWIEAVSEFLGLLYLSAALISTVRVTADGPRGPESWIRDNLGRMARYGVWAYVQHLTILFYGSSPNRLLAGRLLDVSALAYFGFAQSLADVIRRYLPAQLLQGLIRPVLVAHYTASRDFSDAARRSNLVFKVNLCLIGFMLQALIVAGTPVVELMTAGKYGYETAVLLVALLIVIALESMRVQLDTLITVVEKNKALLHGNLYLSASLLIAFPLVALYGAMAIPAANLAGLVISNAVVLHSLRRLGFICPVDWSGITRISIAVIVAALAGTALRWVLPWWLALASGLVAYVLTCWRLMVLNRDEIDLLRRLRPGQSTTPSNAASN